MKKKRVKIFVDCEVLVIDHFSGIGHYTASLLAAIDSLLSKKEYENFEVEIGAPQPTLHKLDRFKFKNLEIRSIPMPHRVINGLKRKNKLPPIDLLFGKKIYIFPNFSSWPTIFSPSIPIIYDLSFVHHSQFSEPRNRDFLVKQVALSVKRASKVLTISEHSKKEIVDEYKIPEKKVFVVYPAVDFKTFYKRSDDEIKKVKATYSVFGKYILFVGNIEPRKNLVTLLKAYKKLPKNIQDEYSLLLVGAKGWLDKEINDLIISMRMDGLKIVQPTNYVEDKDLPALYSGATLFAYVSRYEGFGIPPIESMACGTPVISSDNSSLPEAVGDAAVLVNALDEKEIANAIENTLESSDSRNKLTSKGYEQIKKFSWVESAIKVLSAAEELSQ